MIQNDTVVAISTAKGEGGIGIVRLSGPEALSIGRRIFCCRPPLGERVRHVEYGHIWVAGRPIDSGVAWFFKRPQSYTGEDTVEISCHGSMVVLETVVGEAIRLGASGAGPGEFTRRAYLNGKLDLLEAEAVIDLIQATSRGSVENAYGQAGGRLSAMVRALKIQVVKALSLLEIGLDFSEEDIDALSRQSILAELREVLDLSTRLGETFEGTRRRQDGYLIALIGRPNVGKSTLLNTLLGEDRAIVTAKPGTTRDLVEGRTVWSGEAFRIVDTAGMRETDDPIEIEGIKRAAQIAHEADLVFAIFDSSEKWSDDDQAVLKILPFEKSIAIFNKVDLPLLLDRSKIQNTLSVVEISARADIGTDNLKRETLFHMPPIEDVDGVGVTKQRHQECLLRVSNASASGINLLASGEPDECVVVELQDALRALGDMLGESTDEEVLNSIFSEFCIGK